MLPANLKTQFLSAIRRLLRPVVRQAIEYGVPYPSVAQLLKQLFVEVAERDFPLTFKRQTDSRLAVVTGIHRKEIGQLRRAGFEESSVRVEDTPVTHVIGRWMAGPPYATPDGVALPLLYESIDERVPTFVKMVQSLGIDLPPRTVLDEMLRLNAAELRGDGSVLLREQAYIPATGVEGKLTLLGSDPAELFSVILGNIERPDSPRLQRKVVYDNVGAEALAEIRQKSAQLGEEFLRRGNALLSSYDRDRAAQAPGGRRSRVVLGIYFFDEEEGDTQPPSASPAKPPGRIRRSR